MNRFALAVVVIAILIAVSSSFAQIAARWAIAGCNNVGTIYGAQDNNGATISLDNLMFQSQEAKCVALGFPQSMELLRDGSGIVDNQNTPWKTLGTRIYFMGNPAKAFNYKLSGVVLTLTNDNKDEALYMEPSAVKKTKEVAANAARSGTVTDKRDGKIYKTVRIGNQNWMAQNLNYQTGQSWCIDKNISNCEKYGRLYDWNTAKTACLNGWHLPSREEWGALAVAAGGTGTYGDGGTAGKALKSTYGWVDNGNGTDDFGFSALPNGVKDHLSSDWWTATENGSDRAYYRSMYYSVDIVGENYFGKGVGHSVRCVQN